MNLPGVLNEHKGSGTKLYCFLTDLSITLKPQFTGFLRVLVDFINVYGVLITARFLENRAWILKHENRRDGGRSPADFEPFQNNLRGNE